VYAIARHYAPQRLCRKHHPTAIQAMSQHLPYLALVVSQAGLSGKLDEDVDTGHVREFSSLLHRTYFTPSTSVGHLDRTHASHQMQPATLKITELNPTH
jgi:hypothetical protein